MKVKFFFLLLFFNSCFSTDNKVLVRNNGETQGSFYHIQYLSDYGNNYKFQIDSILLEIDSSLSIYQDFSTISKLNNKETLIVDSLFSNVFNVAKYVYIHTEGYFDCSVFPLVKEWGFYNNRLSDSIIIDSLNFQNILKHVGFDKINLANDSLFLPDNMMLDFNSIAQGYSVDIIAQFLESHSIDDYLIEIGGELKAKGKNVDGEVWKVGIDKPQKDIDLNERFQFVLELENKALATSGNYRRFYEKDGVKYSHVINPITGFPCQNRLLSVSVIHDKCMLADAYATAFMVMGVKKSKIFLSKNSEIAACLVYTGKDGEWKTYISPLILNAMIN